MAGFTKPTTTQTPDALFDYWLPRVARSELRVLLYAVRRTFGFKKDDDAISREQFLHGITTRDGRVLDEGTGIRSGATLTSAITNLVEKGLLIRRKRCDPERGDLVSIFSTAISDDPAERATHGHSFRPVNTTQVPDDLFDYWLSRLSDSELCVLLYIIRRTMGFRKQADVISVSQFLSGIRTRDGRVLDEGCGIRTEQALYRALGGLKDKQLIRAEQRRDDERGSLPTRYHLVFESTLPKVLMPDPRAVSTDDLALMSTGPDKDAYPCASNSKQFAPGRGVNQPSGGGQLEGAGGSVDEGLRVQPVERGRPGSGDRGGQLRPGPRSVTADPGTPVADARGGVRSTPQYTELQETEIQQTERQWTGHSKLSNDTSTRLHPDETSIRTAAGAVVGARPGLGPGGRLYSALIASCIEDWSKEFHDSDHFIQNRTRAMRLWTASGLDEDHIMDLMYEARRRTRRALVTKEATDNKSAFAGAKNRIPYFFATLQDLIDAEHDEDEDEDER